MRRSSLTTLQRPLKLKMFDSARPSSASMVSTWKDTSVKAMETSPLPANNSKASRSRWIPRCGSAKGCNQEGMSVQLIAFPTKGRSQNQKTVAKKCMNESAPKKLLCLFCPFDRSKTKIMHSCWNFSSDQVQILNFCQLIHSVKHSYQNPIPIHLKEWLWCYETGSALLTSAC